MTLPTASTTTRPSVQLRIARLTRLHVPQRRRRRGHWPSASVACRQFSSTASNTSACTTSLCIWVKPTETILHIHGGGVALLPCAARDGHVGSVSSGIWRACIHRAGYGNFNDSPALRSRVFARHCLRSRSSPTSGLQFWLSSEASSTFSKDNLARDKNRLFCS